MVIKINTDEFKIKIGSEYELLSEYINSKTKIKLKHKICNTIFDDINPDEFINKHYGCPYCYAKSSKRWTLEILKRKVNEITNGEYIAIDFISIGKYLKSHFIYKHLKCNNTHQIKISDFFKENPNRCPYCYGNAKKSLNKFKEELKLLGNNEYILIDEKDYVNNKSNIKLLHKKCNNIFHTTPDKFISRGLRCKCEKSTSSILSNKIKEYLDNNHIKYKEEYTFNDCKYKRNLYFDFACFIDNNLILIEADGIQHFKPTFGINSFQEQQIRDNIKNNYCLENNLKLVRISYLEENNIKNILDDLFKE